MDENTLINAGAGLLGAVIGAAITVVAGEIRHRHTAKSDLRYLVVIVTSRLEELAQHCCAVVQDDGMADGQPAGKDGKYQAQVKVPSFEPSALAVEWRALPIAQMSAILDIPYKIAAANAASSYAADNDFGDGLDYLVERQLQYARLGLFIIEASKKLRKTGGLPNNDMAYWETTMRIRKNSIEDQRTRAVRLNDSLADPMTVASELRSKFP